MANLFISYSRKDSDFARKLTDCLKDQKLDFWIDWEGIAPSVDWRKQIEDGIEKAGIFIFLMSPDTARSEVCRWEIDHAVRNGKRLIPIVVRKISAAEAPPDLGKLHWILILEIENRDSIIVEENLPKGDTLFEGWIAHELKNMLAAVVKEGAATKARELKRPVYGKTGTTNDYADAWFIGFDDDIAVGVWVGRDDHTPIGNKETGAQAALPIWIEFMKQVGQE